MREVIRHFRDTLGPGGEISALNDPVLQCTVIGRLNQLKTKSMPKRWSLSLLLMLIGYYHSCARYYHSNVFFSEKKVTCLVIFAFCPAV